MENKRNIEIKHLFYFKAYFQLLDTFHISCLSALKNGFQLKTVFQLPWKSLLFCWSKDIWWYISVKHWIYIYFLCSRHGKKDYDTWFSCMKMDQDNILKIIQVWLVFLAPVFFSSSNSEVKLWSISCGVRSLFFFLSKSICWFR